MVNPMSAAECPMSLHDSEGLEHTIGPREVFITHLNSRYKFVEQQGAELILKDDAGNYVVANLGADIWFWVALDDSKSSGARKIVAESNTLEAARVYASMRAISAIDTVCSRDYETWIAECDRLVNESRVGQQKLSSCYALLENKSLARELMHFYFEKGESTQSALEKLSAYEAQGTVVDNHIDFTRSNYFKQHLLLAIEIIESTAAGVSASTEGFSIDETFCDFGSIPTSALADFVVDYACNIVDFGTPEYRKLVKMMTDAINGHYSIKSLTTASL